MSLFIANTLSLFTIFIDNLNKNFIHKNNIILNNHDSHRHNCSRKSTIYENDFIH